MLADHINRAPAEARSRDLLVPRQAFDHWVMDPLNLYLLQATRSLYASSGPKAEGVPTNNQRGRGSGLCRLWGGLDKARHIVKTTLLVRVQRFRNDSPDYALRISLGTFSILLYKAVKVACTSGLKCLYSLVNYF